MTTHSKEFSCLFLLGTLLLSASSWAAESTNRAVPLTAASTNAPAGPSATSPAATATNAAPAEVTLEFLPEPADYDPDEMYPRINILLRGGRSFAAGAKLFEVAQCTMCHRFGSGSGGIGPDITGAGSRFDTRELLESIIVPSKVISDLYGARIYTMADGKSYKGRNVGEDADTITLSQGWAKDPKTGTSYWGAEETLVRLKRDQIEATEEDTETSPMPTGLVSMFKEETIADLAAFLISGGDPDHKMFKPAPPRPAPAPAPAP